MHLLLPPLKGGRSCLLLPLLKRGRSPLLLPLLKRGRSPRRRKDLHLQVLLRLRRTASHRHPHLQSQNVNDAVGKSLNVEDAQEDRLQTGKEDARNNNTGTRHRKFQSPNRKKHPALNARFSKQLLTKNRTSGS